ncbi:Uncharacterised protein [Klebsiella pneumoniae]|nr:Uncharacterised protein [Klebsiella pneumoniae]
MLKRLTTGLLLLSVAACVSANGNTEPSTNIDDSVYDCDYFFFDKKDNADKIMAAEKKGRASLYIENTDNDALFLIATLSDATSVSTPPLQYQEKRTKGVAYGYESISGDVYQLIISPKVGPMLAIDARAENIKVGALLRNCTIRYTVTAHGGDDGL